ncbi:50S ribosomal protein L28 [Spiroplasma endosymbiont of Agriotes lineatus]|uniref:50S ribosomal protein L28 n=1 Tax=Spiroplasma endosymbiont of Agriotes lineatus TaxID=3077930 RepID=UPI0030CF858B
MSRKCEVTGKSVLSGNKLSHAMNASRRKWNVNLQTVKVEIDGQVKKVKMSTRALRTLKRKGV